MEGEKNDATERRCATFEVMEILAPRDVRPTGSLRHPEFHRETNSTAPLSLPPYTIIVSHHERNVSPHLNPLLKVRLVPRYTLLKHFNAATSETSRLTCSAAYTYPTTESRPTPLRFH